MNWFLRSKATLQLHGTEAAPDLVLGGGRRGGQWTQEWASLTVKMCPDAYIEICTEIQPKPNSPHRRASKES